MSRAAFLALAAAAAQRFGGLRRADLVVALLMLHQTLGGDEALAALFALVGLVVIHLLVILQIADAGEAFAAMAALEQAARDVSEEVFLQAARLLERLSAVAAIVGAPPLRAVVSEFVQG